MSTQRAGLEARIYAHLNAHAGFAIWHAVDCGPHGIARAALEQGKKHKYLRHISLALELENELHP